MGGPGSGAKPREYPSEVIDLVCGLYKSGLTVAEIRERVGPRPGYRIQTVLERYLPERRAAAKREQRGERNHAWKGDEAGYKALHLRVGRARGKPSLCAHCDRTEGQFEWALVEGGDYANVNDYMRLCVPCHRAYDHRGRRPNGQFVSKKEVMPHV